MANAQNRSNMQPQSQESGKTESGSRYEATLFGLPYDIRFLIYEHVFPSGSHISMLATQDSITTIFPEDNIFLELLRTCKALRAEVGAFLYGRYLFSIFGTKKDCLAAYEGFLQTMQQHVRERVRVVALSNGPHSSTMGISFGASDAKMALVTRRGRGQPMEIEEMMREVGMKVKGPQNLPVWSSMSIIMATGIAMLAIMIAMLLYSRPWISKGTDEIKNRSSSI